MFLVNKVMENINIGTAAIIVVLGMVVVFIGLILLMWVTQITGKIMVASTRKKAEQEPEAPVPAPACVHTAAPARGSAGEVKLHSVPDRTAAILMAIVADKLGKPLNELRFISIREIEQ
jgi:sodium pump decarboxylase gamma subunit